MQLAGVTAVRHEQKLYLVGGVVRDLLLGRPNLDLDLVVEANAIQLAEQLAALKKGKVIAHSRFNTARIKWDKWSVDIATARSESYEKPGALPSIASLCEIRSDLVRRDFTINAMAVDLGPLHYGELIDLYQGRQDLEKRLIRILHDRSFQDDATRMWRAVRYEQRLDFRIEPHTLELLKRDLKYLDSISGDRIRHELELCLEEDRPEKCLLRADELGLLARMCPAMKFDDWAARKISKARGILEPYCPPEELYLAFMAYRLSLGDLKDWAAYLNFPRAAALMLEDTLTLKNNLPVLAAPEMTASGIYHELHHYRHTAILANLMANDRAVIKQRIDLYLNTLCHVQTALTGEDLKEMGMASGPQIKEVLESLREARLDGKVTSREEELKLVQKLGKEAG
jgi:tRNA nucleotidyltransferase (CCA-adding enzyme)